MEAAVLAVQDVVLCKCMLVRITCKHCGKTRAAFIHAVTSIKIKGIPTDGAFADSPDN